ncbi:hypothetical protein A2397_02135 [Candidatus Amesbacteria bacterium RIFOXYB1_FULL_44_23]|uniref:Protein kinase domain-containing protein n=1 Tax=Candidatus Amesbacteria bacterium RIFOXYB1_FULL_44_23 TaxID=1797263 RepID=A0A1F4ZVQ5_9BACT|nr:MAG: hypothetical protein A2397_02135 [Candidatus Amesbacteria bacterium RIFOXYB1_FULL_44_23]
MDSNPEISQDRPAAVVRALSSKKEWAPQTPSGLTIDLNSPLGAGDFAITYQGKLKGKKVVVKMLFPRGNTVLAYGDNLIADQFKIEAEILMKNTHPNLALAYATTEIPLTSTKKFPALVREFLPVTATEHIATLPSSDRLPQVAAMVTQIASALDYLRETEQVINTDISPAQIWRRDDGSYALSDLGMTVSTVTQHGLVGTNEVYSPPELNTFTWTQAGQIEVANPQAQVYSLAAVAYQALGGRLPDYNDFQNGASLDPNSIPNAPSELVTIFQKALAKESKDRYQNPTQFAQRLKSVLEPETIG